MILGHFQYLKLQNLVSFYIFASVYLGYVFILNIYLLGCAGSQLLHTRSFIFITARELSVAACGIQFPDQGLNPRPLAQGAWSLILWTTREVAGIYFHISIFPTSHCENLQTLIIMLYITSLGLITRNLYLLVLYRSGKQTHSEGQGRQWSAVYYTGGPKAECPLRQGP